MFTGIVEGTSKIESIRPGSRSIRLVLHSAPCTTGLKLGDSLAVNGCCLTVATITGRKNQQMLGFDLLQETWRRTNLQCVKPGSLVNLERPLRANGRLDGHFVTGHIDGLGKIAGRERKGADYLFEITAPAELMRYIVFKGSIALDGISLTIAKVTRRSFQVWIIPHTFSVTALRERKVGDAVNLETDLLGKYVEKFTAAR